MPAKPARSAKAKSTGKAKPAARSPRARAATPAKRAAKATPKAATPASPKKESARKATKEAAPAVRRSSAELHFTETTILRGEAIEPGEATPSGATHEIAGHDDCGQPILKRKRFSIY
jgi:hypothetical protein